jgi:hypothetical protein
MPRFLALAALAFVLSCTYVTASLVSVQLTAQNAVLSLMGKP